MLLLSGEGYFEIHPSSRIVGFTTNVTLLSLVTSICHACLAYVPEHITVVSDQQSWPSDTKAKDFSVRLPLKFPIGHVVGTRVK